jgi:hypothetical protein
MAKLSFLVAVVSLLVVPNVFAWDCDNRVQINIFTAPYEYVINRLETANDSGCWSMDPYITWNSSAGLWEFTTYFQQAATRTVTPGSGGSTFTAQCNVDFYDPNASWWNFIGIDVDVNHNGTHTYYTVYSNRGTLGNTNDSGNKWTYFNAVSGDAVTLRINGGNSYSGSGTHVRFGGCYIFQSSS